MNRTATVTLSHGPGPGPGPAPPAIPRKLRPGNGERRRGRGARVKRRRRRGSPAPYLGKIAGAIVHFSTSCTARPPNESLREPLRTNPKNESLGHSGLGPPEGGLGARKSLEKFVSDAAHNLDGTKDVANALVRGETDRPDACQIPPSRRRHQWTVSVKPAVVRT